jgi:hypothetical protein
MSVGSPYMPKWGDVSIQPANTWTSENEDVETDWTTVSGTQVAVWSKET